MFQRAYSLTIKFIFSPAEAWTVVNCRKNDRIPTSFLFPLWIVIILFALIGSWFLLPNGSFELGLKNALTQTISLFGAYYISSFILNEYIAATVPQKKNLRKAQNFIAYASALMYLINIVVAMFKDFFFLWIFSFYTFYIVSVGAEIFYRFNAQRRTQFSALATLLIIVMPLIIKYSLSLIVK